MELIEYIKKAIYINLIYEDRYELILSGLKATLILTIVSFVAGTLLGMAFCAGKGSRNRVVRTLCRLFTQLMVKLPPLVLLMIFAYLIFVNSSLTPVAIAVVTFTLKCASHLAEMFRTAVAPYPRARWRPRGRLAIPSGRRFSAWCSRRRCIR